MPKTLAGPLDIIYIILTSRALHHSPNADVEITQDQEQNKPKHQDSNDANAVIFFIKIFHFFILRCYIAP